MWGGSQISGWRRFESDPCIWLAGPLNRRVVWVVFIRSHCIVTPPPSPAGDGGGVTMQWREDATRWAVLQDCPSGCVVSLGDSRLCLRNAYGLYTIPKRTRQRRRRPAGRRRLPHACRRRRARPRRPTRGASMRRWRRTARSGPRQRRRPLRRLVAAAPPPQSGRPPPTPQTLITSARLPPCRRERAPYVKASECCGPCWGTPAAR